MRNRNLLLAALGSAGVALSCLAPGSALAASGVFRDPYVANWTYEYTTNINGIASVPGSVQQYYNTNNGSRGFDGANTSNGTGSTNAAGSAIVGDAIPVNTADNVYAPVFNPVNTNGSPTNVMSIYAASSDGSGNTYASTGFSQQSFVGALINATAGTNIFIKDGNFIEMDLGLVDNLLSYQASTGLYVGYVNITGTDNGGITQFGLNSVGSYAGQVMDLSYVTLSPQQVDLFAQEAPADVPEPSSPLSVACMLGLVGAVGLGRFGRFGRRGASLA